MRVMVFDRSGRQRATPLETEFLPSVGDTVVYRVVNTVEGHEREKVRRVIKSRSIHLDGQSSEHWLYTSQENK